MDIVGIDLSGPGSPEHTAVARFSARPDALVLESLTIGADDAEIIQLISDPSSVIGIDAPLSYAPGGGSRESDIVLRELVTSVGLPSGSVMAPAAPRMAYLTLRGVSLTRMLKLLAPSARIVEVHPTAALAIRGASIDVVRTFKRSQASRLAVLRWLETQGLRRILPRAEDSDHAVAACAAALAAWKWQSNEAAWLYEADPPVHPYDFAC